MSLSLRNLDYCQETSTDYVTPPDLKEVFDIAKVMHFCMTSAIKSSCFGRSVVVDSAKMLLSLAYSNHNETDLSYRVHSVISVAEHHTNPDKYFACPRCPPLDCLGLGQVYGSV